MTIGIYSILIPALTVPVMAPAKSSPVAVDERTINKRSPTASGTGGKLEASPYAISPIDRRSIVGNRSTRAPVGVKVELPAGAL